MQISHMTGEFYHSTSECKITYLNTDVIVWCTVTHRKQMLLRTCQKSSKTRYNIDEASELCKREESHDSFFAGGLMSVLPNIICNID